MSDLSWKTPEGKKMEGMLQILRDENAALRSALSSVAKQLDEWLHTPTLLLRAGEMTEQEIRTVKAVLIAVREQVRKDGGL